MSDDKKCAHTACTCLAADKSKYCSPVCENSKEVTDIVCQCGHPACRGEALKP